jgi:hypothetical protein
MTLEDKKDANDFLTQFYWLLVHAKTLEEARVAGLTLWRHMAWTKEGMGCPGCHLTGRDFEPLERMPRLDT